MAADSEESEAGSEFNWQIIVNKRKRHQNSPKLYQNKRKQTNNNEEPSISNQFAMLQNDNDEQMRAKGNNDDTYNDDDDEESKSETGIPKPPPIYIPDVININKMISNISIVISRDEFSYKCLKNNQVRLMIKTVESYRKIVKYLEIRNISFHTFQLKQERSYRVVIKGIHSSSPVEDIKAALISMGYPVRSVTNIRSRATKEPLSMFYVDLDPISSNKEIFNLRHLNNAVISVEAPRKSHDLVQCHRCQLFGHTKAYCKRPFNCVKCGLNHPTTDCKKDLNTPPRCYHCLKDHTASYKGCQVYKQILQKKLQDAYNSKTQCQSFNFNINQNDFPQLNAINNTATNQFP